MKITVLTVCPEMFRVLQEDTLVKRAADRGLLDVRIIDMKEYAGGSFRHIDDDVYGGGAGMVIRYPVVYEALQEAGEGHRVLLSASGSPYTQQKARSYAAMDHVILICGHYEGIDARIEEDVNEEISLGDFIVSGGELPAAMIIDSVARLLGTIRDESTEDESYEHGRLEYPQYTRPQSYNGREVPGVLLSGDHERIQRWRRKVSLKRTLERRPDMAEKTPLSEEERELLAELSEEG